MSHTKSVKSSDLFLFISSTSFPPSLHQLPQVCPGDDVPPSWSSYHSQWHLLWSRFTFLIAPSVDVCIRSHWFIKASCLSYWLQVTLMTFIHTSCAMRSRSSPCWTAWMIWGRSPTSGYLPTGMSLVLQSNSCTSEICVPFTISVFRSLWFCQVPWGTCHPEEGDFPCRSNQQWQNLSRHPALLGGQVWSLLWPPEAAGSWNLWEEQHCRMSSVSFFSSVTHYCYSNLWCTIVT